ncbi:MAG: crotonase/enoyl-CoA hydratase family protein [Myxococcota bacterium]
MTSLVDYDLSDGVATLTMDDARVNAMSPAMLRALHRAFERAEKDGAVVLLTGREGIFSAGFDLAVFRLGRQPTLEMLRLGATLAERVLAFPYPVVTACNGHAYPMGAFLMLAADRRVGAAGDFRIGLNEVSIALTLPLFAVEIARQRLAPAYFQRAVVGDLYGPEEAVVAGFLDEVVAPEKLRSRALEIAKALTALDFPSHAATKLRVRGQALTALRAAIEEELH